MTMQTNAGGGTVSPLWTLGFRPFFLAAAAWAALALLLWIIALQSGASLPSQFDPLSWHIHEMLFGFVPAAIAGFLLTAIPTWTGRPPIQGRLLAGLAGIWFFGRMAVLLSSELPTWLTGIIDVSFLFLLSAIAAYEIAISRNRRNMAIPLPILVLAVANLLMHLEAAGVAVPAGLGWRLGLAAITVLISVIGGRIIPAFTRNWLNSRNPQAVLAPHGLVDSAGMGLLHGGLIGWALVPDSKPVGVLLILAAIANFLRLLRWKGVLTLAEPLLAILHVGFLWLVGSAALLGASMLTDRIPISAAIHAMTAGTIGTTVLAVMTRVSLGHTGRILHADHTTSLIYVLVTVAAVARVFAPFEQGHYTVLLEASAALWIGAFAAFGIRYASLLFSSRIK
jgi:uncharacterized protein involved in response to NO